MGAIACGGVVASIGADPRQAFQSKTTNPIATANHTKPVIKLARAKSAPTTAHNPPIVMVPWAEWDTMLRSTLPPVWLKSHV